MEYLLFIILGAISGTLAGLLGIGGGVVLVPGLAMIFSKFVSIDSQSVMQLASGTSLGAIAFTSLSSVRSHNKRDAVDFTILKKLFPFILVGVICGSKLSHLIKGEYLEIIFGMFLLFVSYNMIFGLRKISESDELIAFNAKWIDKLIGATIGIKSGLLGIGGGTISVPYLAWKKVGIRKAIGTSALFGMCLSWGGAISHFTFGYIETQNFLAGVYLPALICIAPMSMLFAPLGVRLSHSLPTSTLRKVFGVFVLFMAFKMFY